VALNGFRHSLRRCFNDRVEIVDRFNWAERNAIRFAKTITEPTTVIGFSDGATAALTIANHTRHVRVVVAHSPMFRQEEVRTTADLYFFRTVGDRTPTFEATEQAWDWYCEGFGEGTAPTYLLTDLEPLPALPVHDLATAMMRRKVHQFHNCLRDFRSLFCDQIVADNFRAPPIPVIA
jgi:S-formylglutathione hydrolase FrmB